MVRFAERLIGEGDQNPDDAGSDHHRLALAQMQLLFEHHQHVGRDKQDARREFPSPSR
jgi:hypothetical protein